MIRSWVKWVALLVFWTIPGLLLAGQLYFNFKMEGHPHGWWPLVFWLVPGWYFWVAATPWILWLAGRVPIGRDRWLRPSLTHLGAAIALALLHILYLTALTKWLGPEGYRGVPWMTMFLYVLAQRLHIDFLTYGGILGIGYGLDYYRKFRERELEASQLEAQLAQAQLQALKMQLHPHFLFNTLHAISVLVRKRSNDEAVRMLAGLSDLLRLALENVGTQEVSLKQELDFLQRYLELEQIRFQDRLRVQMSIDPDTLDASVPNLILQPLVENAIRHGVAPKPDAGVVEISARRQGERLHVKISDDGPGLPNGGRGPESEGVGLSNTRKRLQRLYGEDHRFQVRTAERGGTIAELEIAFRAAAIKVG